MQLRTDNINSPAFPDVVLFSDHGRNQYSKEVCGRGRLRPNETLKIPYLLYLANVYFIVISQIIWMSGIEEAITEGLILSCGSIDLQYSKYVCVYNNLALFSG